MDYDTIEKNAKGFIAPQAKITVGGKKISENEYMIQSLQVNTSSGPEAGTCNFTVADIFDHKNSQFKGDIYDTLDPGKKVEVSLGYTNLERVFIGYIHSIHFDYSSNGVVLAVNCMDGMGALFYSSRWRQFKKTDKIQDVAKSVLAPCKPYVDKIIVSSFEYDSERDVDRSAAYVQDNIDDYAFIKKLANLVGAQFAVVDGELIFSDKPASDSKETIGLEWGKNILHFNADVDLSNQVGSIGIYSKSAKNAPIAAEETGSTIGGTGKLPKDAAIVAGKSIDTTVLLAANEKQAKTTAQSQYNAMVSDYVKASAAIIGIPSIMVGSKVEFKKLGKGLADTYTISNVIHKFDVGGYITEIKCKKERY